MLSDDELKSVLGDEPVTVLPERLRASQAASAQVPRHMYGTPIKSSGAAAAMTDRHKARRIMRKKGNLPVTSLRIRAHKAIIDRI